MGVYKMKVKAELSNKVCKSCECEAFTPGSHNCGNCGTYHEEAAKVDYIEDFDDDE